MFACNTCNREFTTKTGLGVHRRRAHQNTFHAEEFDRIFVRSKVGKSTNARWTEEDGKLLALAEAKLTGQLSLGAIIGGAKGKGINQLLADKFPGRTVDAIKGQRRKAQHKQWVLHYISSLTSSPLRSPLLPQTQASPRQGLRDMAGEFYPLAPTLPPGSPPTPKSGSFAISPFPNRSRDLFSTPVSRPISQTPPTAEPPINPGRSSPSALEPPALNYSSDHHVDTRSVSSLGESPPSRVAASKAIGEVSFDLFSDSGTLNTPEKLGLDTMSLTLSVSESGDKSVCDVVGALADSPSIAGGEIGPRQTLVDFLVGLPSPPGATAWDEPSLNKAVSCISEGRWDEARSALDAHATNVIRSLNATRVTRRSRANSTLLNPGELSNRQKRRRQYARLQDLYRKNKSAASKEVLDGKWREEQGELPPNEVFPFWEELFSRPSQPDERPFVPQELRRSLLKPFSEAELKKVLKSIRNSAPGPDGLTVRQLKAIPMRILVKVLNLWIVCEHTPVPWRECVTTLIPKVLQLTQPGQFRPITISSSLVRLVNKVVNSRLDSTLRLIARQKGFQPLDGCAENLALLKSIINKAKMLQHSVYLAFLDMAKAFDSVSHHSIARAMERFGVPSILRNYILSGYSGATTKIRYAGSLSNSIPMTRGVKQGDPLSPLLFNLVINEALEKLQEGPVGIMYGDDNVSTLAYCDDLVVVAKTAAGLQASISNITEILRGSGLEVNPQKCKTLCLAVSAKHKKFVVDTHTDFMVNDRPLGKLAPEDTYKYLGIQIGSSGPADSSKQLLLDGLRQISEAPLKPQQRISILVEVLLPRLQHRLVLGRTCLTTLRSFDRLIRKHLRQWLHLAKDAPISFLHARTADGGLGVPTLAATTFFLKQDRLLKLLQSPDQVIQRVTEEEGYSKELANWCGPINVLRTQCRTKKDVAETYKNKLYSTCDGKGLSRCNPSAIIHGWPLGQGPSLKGKEYIRAIQVRAGSLATPARLTRVFPERTGLCEVCHSPGTLGHISQSCPRSHGLRVKRHDNLVDFFSGRLRQLGFSVLQEPRIGVGNSFLKPDLVAIKDGTAHVLDAQVVADQVSMGHAHNRKVGKYDIPPVRNWLLDLPEVTGVKFTSITLNWRGDWECSSASTLRKLGISKINLTIASVKALTWTHSIWRNYTKAT